MESLHATTRWENQPVPEGVTIADLDAEEIRTRCATPSTLAAHCTAQRRTSRPSSVGWNSSTRASCSTPPSPSTARAQRLHIALPAVRIRLARFRGTDRLGDFIDNRQYWGHAFDLAPPGGDVPAGPCSHRGPCRVGPNAARRPAALSAACNPRGVANALCHRDYTIPGGAISVAMYDDHLEIINPGTLHFGITPAKLAHAAPIRSPGIRSSPMCFTGPGSSNVGARAR